MPYAVQGGSYGGEEWVPDGDWMVKKSLVDQYGINDDRAQVGRLNNVDWQIKRAQENTGQGGYQDVDPNHDPGGWAPAMNYLHSTGFTNVQNNPLVSGIRYGHVKPYGDNQWAEEGINGVGQIYNADGSKAGFGGDVAGFSSPTAQQRYQQLQQALSGQAGAAPPKTTDPTQGGEPVKAATKVVNGVTYAQQPDGTWLKQDQPAAPPTTPPAGPPVSPPQLSSMVGAQQRTLAGMQGGGFGEVKQSPPPQQAPAPVADTLKPLKMPPLMGGNPQPTLSGGFGALKQPTMPKMPGMGKMPSFNPGKNVL